MDELALGGKERKVSWRSDFGGLSNERESWRLGGKERGEKEAKFLINCLTDLLPDHFDSFYFLSYHLTMFFYKIIEKNFFSAILSIY